MSMIPAWISKPGVLKAGRIIGYILFGVVVFSASLVLTFPTGRLRSFIENKASQSGYVVRINDLSITGVSSLSMYGVNLDLPPDVRMERDGTRVQIPRTILLDRLDVGLNLFSLLFGDLSVTLTAESGDGVLGPVHVVRTDKRLEVEIDEIEDFPVPRGLPVFGVRFAGTLNGKGRLDYNMKGGITTSNGRMELTGRDLVALKPTLRSEQHGDATLSDVYLGTLKVALTLDRQSRIKGLAKPRRNKRKGDATVLHLETVEINGKDLKAIAEGHSMVRMFPGKGMADGQLNVELSFSLSDDFFERQVTTRGETDAPNRFLKTLLGMDPRWRRASSAGYWGVMCTGSVRRPNCIPKKPIIRGGDFKVPDKEVDEPAKKEKPAPARAIKPQPKKTRQVEPVEAPSGRARVAPPKTYQPREPATAADEAAKAANLNTMKPAPVITNGPPRAVVPTIIGRSRRLRQVKNLEEEPTVEEEDRESDDEEEGEDEEEEEEEE